MPMAHEEKLAEESIETKCVSTVEGSSTVWDSLTMEDSTTMRGSLTVEDSRTMEGSPTAHDST